MKEQIVVTMTSWAGRITNIPAVIDSILAQTVKPDVVVVNLAEAEFFGRRLPQEVQDYINAHEIVRVNWRRHNTRVFKKILPSLALYPDALFMCIDDDYIYPPTMIEEFMKIHEQYPDDPISGNHFYYHGLKCHSGNASMVQAKHLVGWEIANSSLFRSRCLSDDIFYTLLAAKNGYLYRETATDYNRLDTYNENTSYSRDFKVSLRRSWNACYEAMGMVVVHFPNPGKPKCVLGAMQTLKGKKIEERMLQWLTPIYDVYVVEHDGKAFEYTAIKFMHDVMKEPCLYIHAKGAVYKHGVTNRAHRMWRHEFGVKWKEYFDAVEGEGAIVATPYCSPDNITWFNGWVANAEAIRTMNLIKTNDRFHYEYHLFPDAKVKGLRMDNVLNDNKLFTMHQDLIKDFGE